MNLQVIFGNFSLILFVLTMLSGVIWSYDVFYLAKRRRARADHALIEFDSRNARLQAEGVKQETAGRSALETDLLRQPMWIEYSGSFFPVIALVFCLRSFLFEPFKIPSPSMVPTLQVGDLILVNKFTYGIRLPLLNKKIVEIGNPQRGDVMVFKYPKDMTLDYIKRVVGVPGDKIVYKNKRLSINDEALSYQPLPDYLDDERLTYSKQYVENLTGVQHKILNRVEAPDDLGGIEPYPMREACDYNSEGFACTVPAGHYFMMGDNRDNSADSRYWGFVPDQNIVGKAFFVWMNLGNLKRIGSIK